MKYCHWNPYTIVSSLKEPRYNQEVLTCLVCKSYPSCIVNKPQNVRSHGVRLTAKYFSTNLSVVINPWSVIIIETSVSQVRKLLIERPKAVHSLFLCPDHMLLVPMMLGDWACCSEHSSGASPRMDHSWPSIAYRTVSLLSGRPTSQEILHCSMLPSAVAWQPRWFLALTSKPESFGAVFVSSTLLLWPLSPVTQDSCLVGSTLCVTAVDLTPPFTCASWSNSWHWSSKALMRAPPRLVRAQVEYWKEHVNQVTVDISSPKCLTHQISPLLHTRIGLSCLHYRYGNIPPVSSFWAICTSEILRIGFLSVSRALMGHHLLYIRHCFSSFT